LGRNKNYRYINHQLSAHHEMIILKASILVQRYHFLN